MGKCREPRGEEKNLSFPNAPENMGLSPRAMHISSPGNVTIGMREGNRQQCRGGNISIERHLGTPYRIGRLGLMKKGMSGETAVGKKKGRPLDDSKWCAIRRKA